MEKHRSTFDSGPAQSAFPVTHWSVVEGAMDHSTEVRGEQLEQFCQNYWYPLYAFARREGQSPENAKDLTQQFFSLLLEKDWLASADREKGRLRTFLLTAFRRVMLNDARYHQAKARGGSVTEFSWEQDDAESRYATVQAGLSAEETFDRQWALWLMERTYDQLREEFQQTGKQGHFEPLKETLLADRGEIDYSTLSNTLEMNEGAVRVAVHRFRKRFRAIFREEVERTLSEGEDVGEELQYLARVLG